MKNYKQIEYLGYPLLVSEDGELWTTERDVLYSNGRVYHYKSIPIKLYKDHGGYMIATVKMNNKSINIKVHRAVAMAFLPNPNNYPEVNHKDEDKTNNHVDNLEWCDGKYNSNYGTANERQSEMLGHKIRCVETGQIFNSAPHAQRFFGKPKSTNIRCCLNGRQPKAYGYTWEYVNNKQISR